MPKTARKTKAARVEMRMPEDALAYIKRAAEIQGRSVSDFLSVAGQELAKQVITETEIIKLSREAQERFVQLLINPPKPTPAMKRAMKRHKELIIE